MRQTSPFPAFRVLVVTFTGALALGGCRQSPPAAPPPPIDNFRAARPKANTQPSANNGGTRLPNGGLPSGAQMPGGFNMSSPVLPNARLTPGDILDVTAADIAVPGYAGKVRNVSTSLKKKIYASYGITSRLPGEYTIDHLISLQLGGSNSPRNLWPLSYQTQPWNAYIKIALENQLHDEVVEGRMSLPSAQRMIATDWIAAYKKVFKTQLPLKKHMRTSTGHRLYNDNGELR